MLQELINISRCLCSSVFIDWVTLMEENIPVFREKKKKKVIQNINNIETEKKFQHSMNIFISFALIFHTFYFPVL